MRAMLLLSGLMILVALVTEGWAGATSPPADDSATDADILAELVKVKKIQRNMKRLFTGQIEDLEKQVKSLEDNVADSLQAMHDNWVGTVCSGDGVCGPANSKCYLGKCLCDVGFFYSVGRRACVSSCAPADVQTDSYLTYPRGGIAGNNKYSKTGTDDECKQICSQDASCLNTEVYTDKTCYFHYVAATQSNWDYAAGWTFHQKNCA